MLLAGHSGVRQMDQSDNMRMLRLLQTSIDLFDQMAEIHKLRASLKLTENARRVKKPTDAGVAEVTVRPTVRGTPIRL